ncbi:MAG: DUF4982 domain-containing protein [Verrucomicrobiae bacterium]|nr:DUF4982 domain-containing protein [Verrucomicrobiae bacterium]
MLVVLQTGASLFAGDVRDQPFDDNWRFLLGDVAGAENPGFDDSAWRKLDVPHDWSIEDLPPKKDAVPELEAVAGEWRFKQGDDPAWKARNLNETTWEKVTLPDNWERHSNYTANNVYGWFRRQIEIPAECKGRDFDLLLGRIDDVDEAWLNGQRIGGTGSFPPNFKWADTVERRYRVPASLVRGDGSDVLAVRVFDGANKGGMIAAGAKRSRIGPFDPSESQNRHFTGNTVGGTGWYRKHFTVSEAGKRVSVLFDGVYMNPEVWINGRRLGEHPHGYTAFEFDLTPHLKPAGQKNVLAVKVRNEGKNSRWYSGSGIYRHVWLTITDPIHVPTWGVFVTTPEVSPEKALVNISTEVANAGRSEVVVGVSVNVLDPEGNPVGTAKGTLKLPAGKTLATEHPVEVAAPKLWSIDSPEMYSAEVQVVVAGKTVDSVFTAFGIRRIEMDAKNGFRLNGEPLLLKGGCIHHDNGPLGAAAINRAEERKVELLKAQGYNALRSSHNPPSTALLDACDRLGMLMIDESFDQWRKSKENNEQDYHRFFDKWWEHDIASMVRRDRNHPCVIMWSIGNEIPEQFRAEETQKQLREAVLSHDPTRPVTQALCTDWRNKKSWQEYSPTGFKHLDVGGYNYRPDDYEPDHARFPDRVMYGSESYARDAFKYWKHVEEKPYLIGDFVWTAMDYLGESGIGHALINQGPTAGLFMAWPYYNAWCGDIDLIGNKKPQSFYRDVVWRRSPIEMAVHVPMAPGEKEVVSQWGWPNEERSWNWPGQEGTPLQVSVYSRCEKVLLELNGKVIGEKSISEETKLTAKFEVPYAPGELRAVGLVAGKVVAETRLKTSGAPKMLKLTADRSTIRADRSDLSYIAIEVVDENGQRVPNAEIPVRFSVRGAGKLAGQASGVPNKPASFRAPVCTTFHGRCLVILRPTGSPGEITLHAEAEGLGSDSVTIEAK